MVAIDLKRSQSAPYPLQNGDCMMRKEFHGLYEKMPAGYRAELLGGIVFEPSPVSWNHSEHHSQLNYLFKTYSIGLPQVSVGDNATVFLSEEDEVQPDLLLRLSEEAGGTSSLTKRGGYVEGAPELVAEIAYSSRAIDLHLKKTRYALAGVGEYIVVCLNPERVFWFDLANDKQLQVKNGVVRSRVFPGLWIHIEGLLLLEDQKTTGALKKGLESKEYQEFAKKLAKH